MAETSLKKARSGGADSAQGELKIIRPSQLTETGVVAQGKYEGAKPNKFNAEKSDYFIRGSDNTLYIINETTSLREQLGQLNAADEANVKVVYNGKVKTKSGKGFHDFEVFVVS